MSDWELDLAPREVPVVLKDASGNRRPFVLREASAAAAASYRASTTKDSTVTGDPAGTTDVRVQVGMPFYQRDQELVGNCLHEVNEGGVVKEVPVGAARVKSLPDRTVAALAEKVKELSPELDRAPSVELLDKQIAKLTKQRDAMRNGESEAKKAQPATTAPSA